MKLNEKFLEDYLNSNSPTGFEYECEELKQLQTDIKTAMIDNVGIDLNSIKVVKCYLS